MITLIELASAKVWGPPDGRPVLAIHGWLDNANSFDALIPLLPKNLRIVAVDIAGHGLTDHFPPDLSYNYLDSLVVIERLTRQLEWNKFSFLGHSLGGCMAITYAGIFPEKVDKIVSIDAIRPPITYPETIGQRLRKTVNVLLRHEEMILTRPEKPFSFESHVERHITATGGSLDENACKILFQRGLRKVAEGGYVLRRDRRLLAAALSYNPKEENLSQACNITADILIIKTNWPFYENEDDVMKQLEALKTNSKSFRFVQVDGLHHVHLTHPEKVAPIISEFLVK